MSKDQLKTKLTELGIAFDPKAKVAELEALLPVEPVVKPEVSEEATEETEEPKPKYVLGSLGYLGNVAILRINEREINGKMYNDVILVDGTGHILSDKDLKAQVKETL
jgi:hypothetical protein